MIKDIVVDLAVDNSHEVAADYAITLARAFDAHLSGIAFAYDVFLPGSIFGQYRLNSPMRNVPKMSREHEPQSPILTDLHVAPGCPLHRMC
jgi:hypothetical protein